MLRKLCRSKQVFCLVFTLFMGCLSTVAFAENFQNMQAIEQQARNWIANQLSDAEEHHVEFRPLDPRLRLTACPAPLDFQVHGTGELRGRTNLRVSCQESDWFIFITADIQVLSPVVVARQQLNRGARLSSSMLEVRQMDTARIRGDFFTEPSELEGMEVRNRIRAGEAVTSRQVNLTQLVNRGDQVVIQASNDNLRIRMLGEALDSGRLGEQIRVRNLQSGRTVRARIVARGIVEVHL